MRATKFFSFASYSPSQQHRKTQWIAQAATSANFQNKLESQNKRTPNLLYALFPSDAAKANMPAVVYQASVDKRLTAADYLYETAYARKTEYIDGQANYISAYLESTQLNDVSEATQFSSELCDQMKGKYRWPAPFPVSYLLINLIEGTLSMKGSSEMLLKTEEFYALRNYAKEKYFQLKKHLVFLKQSHADKKVINSVENYLSVVINDYHCIGRKDKYIFFKTDIYIPVDQDLISNIYTLYSYNELSNCRELETKQAGALFHQRFDAEAKQVCDQSLENKAFYAYHIENGVTTGAQTIYDTFPNYSLAKVILDIPTIPVEQSVSKYAGTLDAGVLDYSGQRVESIEITPQRQIRNASAMSSGTAYSAIAVDSREQSLKRAEKPYKRIMTQMKGHERSYSTEDTSESGSEPNATLSKMYQPVVTDIMKYYDISKTNGRTTWLTLKNSGSIQKGLLTASDVKHSNESYHSAENEVTDLPVDKKYENAERASRYSSHMNQDVSVSNNRPGDFIYPAIKGLSAQMLLSGSEDSVDPSAVAEAGSVGSSKSAFYYASQDSRVDSTPAIAVDNYSAQAQKNTVLDYSDLPNAKLLIFREYSVIDYLALPLPLKRQLTDQQIYRLINMGQKQQNLGQQQMIHFYAMVNRNYSISYLMEEFPYLTRGGVVHLLRTVLSSQNNGYSYIMIRAREIFEERKSYISDMVYQIKLAYQKVVRELYLLSQ